MLTTAQICTVVFKRCLPKKLIFRTATSARFSKVVAMTLISTVGGASGALYGTFFLQASTMAGGKTELSPSEFGSILEKGLAGIVLRGKAADRR